MEHTPTLICICICIYDFYHHQVSRSTTSAPSRLDLQFCRQSQVHPTRPLPGKIITYDEGCIMIARKANIVHGKSMIVSDKPSCTDATEPRMQALLLKCCRTNEQREGNLDISTEIREGCFVRCGWGFRERGTLRETTRYHCSLGPCRSPTAMRMKHLVPEKAVCREGYREGLSEHFCDASWSTKGL